MGDSYFGKIASDSISEFVFHQFAEPSSKFVARMLSFGSQSTAIQSNENRFSDSLAIKSLQFNGQMTTQGAIQGNPFEAIQNNV